MKSLNEASVGRVYSHTRGRNIGLIIPPSRDEEGATENPRGNPQLRDEIRAQGFGFIKVRCNFVEINDGPYERRFHKEIYLIIGKAGPDGGELKEFLKKQGIKYCQGKVLYKPHDDENVHLLDIRNFEPGVIKVHDAGPWHPRQIGKFYTMFQWDAIPSAGHPTWADPHEVPSMRYVALESIQFLRRHFRGKEIQF